MKLLNVLISSFTLVRYGGLLLLLIVFFSHAVVRYEARNRIVTNPSDLPERSAALLLGTSRYTRSGTPNEFFENRITAAVDALDSGRVQMIVASGDSADPGYNEPLSMYNALRERGVASERIILDHAGFRTLDSVYRMHTYFRHERFVIISQRFHLERALFFASHHGIDAIGFVAKDATGVLNVHVRLREYLARVRAVLDVYVFHTEPRARRSSFPIESFVPFTVN